MIMDLRKSAVSMDPSLIPTDVTFVIEQCGSEVEAHKFVMAMGSPVYMRQFYGTYKETKDRIPVKETTKKSFVIMVDFVYGKEIDWRGMTVDELFHVANMAEKYHIDILMGAVKKVFEDYPLCKDNVVLFASLALEHSQFEEPSKALLLNCSKFLRSVLKTVKDFETFAAKHSESDLCEVAFKLMGMMSRDIFVRDKCQKNTCKRGKDITDYEDVNEGDKVMFSSIAKDIHFGDDQRDQEVQGVVIYKHKTLSKIECVTVKTLEDGGSVVTYFFS
jgi:hypothetical protein